VTVQPADCTPTPAAGLVIAALQPGQSLVCIVSYTVTQAQLNSNESFTGSADASAKGPSGQDPVVGIIPDTVTVAADQNPELVVDVTNLGPSNFNRSGEQGHTPSGACFRDGTHIYFLFRTRALCALMFCSHAQVLCLC
jgi:hypothetical protein